MEMTSADVYIVNADMHCLWQYFSEMEVKEVKWEVSGGLLFTASVHMGNITYNIVYPNLHTVYSTLYHDTHMLYTI